MFVCLTYSYILDNKYKYCFILTITSMEEYITKAGIKKIKKELAQLTSTGRAEIASRLHEAVLQGELPENADYLEAKEAQIALEQKIERLESRLRNAVVVQESKGQETVSVGTRVELARYRSKKPYKVRLVGVEEADISSGDISIDSPLGRVLFGKRAGESVDVETPKGKKRYKIVNII